MTIIPDEATHFLYKSFHSCINRYSTSNLLRELRVSTTFALPEHVKIRSQALCAFIRLCAEMEPQELHSKFNSFQTKNYHQWYLKLMEKVIKYQETPASGFTQYCLQHLIEEGIVPTFIQRLHSPIELDIYLAALKFMHSYENQWRVTFAEFLHQQIGIPVEQGMELHDSLSKSVELQRMPIRDSISVEKSVYPSMNLTTIGQLFVPYVIQHYVLPVSGNTQSRLYLFGPKNQILLDWVLQLVHPESWSLRKVSAGYENRTS